MPLSVLILDPDEEFARTLGEQLVDAGLEAEIPSSVSVAADRITAGTAAALVISSPLPGTDVPTFCRGLRAAGASLPIILLSAPDDAVSLVDAADADEVFTRPIRLGSLISRLRQVLERASSEPEDSITIGPFLFEVVGKRLIPREGTPVIHLTEKETGILSRLAQAGGAIVPREQLLQDVWRYNPDVTTHTLETHIYRLRQKMETAVTGSFLITETGGYRLAGAVIKSFSAL